MSVESIFIFNHAKTGAKSQVAIQEAELWLSPAFDSRDRHVPVQATHRAEAEPAEQQRLTTAQLIAADRGGSSISRYR